MAKNQRPLRPCSNPNCPNLTIGRYCKQHQNEYRNQNRYYDKHQRNKKANRFYHSAAWKKTRDIVKVRDNGLCRECLRHKRITVGTEVDHIVPIKQSWGKRLELDNVQLLCKAGRNKKTGEERAEKG